VDVTAGRRAEIQHGGRDILDDTDATRRGCVITVLADPSHPEHDERLEWVGGPLDPHRFDPDDAERALEWLAWRPLTSDSWSAARTASRAPSRRSRSVPGEATVTDQGAGQR